MADKNIKENVVTEVLKYKPVKYLIVAVLSLLCLLIIFSAVHHFSRCSQNLNSKLFWGMDECLECSTIKIDSVTKRDTAKIVESAPQTLIKPTAHPHTAIKQESKIGDNDAAGRDNNGVQGGEHNHIVLGDNSGINGDVTVTPEIKQEELQKFLKWALYWKDQSIYHIKGVDITAYQGTNSAAAVNQIISLLEKSGFTIEGNATAAIAGATPEGLSGYPDTVRKMLEVSVGIIK
jgi:hypothetical protein